MAHLDIVVVLVGRSEDAVEEAAEEEVHHPEDAAAAAAQADDRNDHDRPSGEMERKVARSVVKTNQSADDYDASRSHFDSKFEIDSRWMAGSPNRNNKRFCKVRATNVTGKSDSQFPWRSLLE